MAGALKTRQQTRCPFTLSNEALVGCHIIHHPLTSISTRHHSAYWALVRFLLGKALCDKVWEIAGGPKKCDETSNGILIRRDFHHLWDTGKMELRPVGSSPTFQEVCLETRGQSVDWKLLRSAVQKLPSDQTPLPIRASKKTSRGMENRDVFRVFTINATTHPLPSWLLLEVRLAVSSCIERSEMTKTLEENARTHGKKRSNMGKGDWNDGSVQGDSADDGGEGQGDETGSAPKRFKTGTSCDTPARQPDASLTPTDSKLCKMLRLRGSALEIQQILTRLCGSPEARARLFSANKSEPPTRCGVQANLPGHPSASVLLSQNEPVSSLESDESSSNSEDMTNLDESDEWESGGPGMESKADNGKFEYGGTP